MFSRIYVFEWLRDGKFVGFGRVKAFFWVSHCKALDRIDELADRHGVCAVNVRILK